MTTTPRTAGQVFGALGRAVCYLFLFLLTQTLVSTVYSLSALIYSMFHDSGQDPLEIVYACTDQITLVSAAATLVILAAFFLLRGKNPLREVGFHRTGGHYVILGFGLAPVCYAAVTTVLSLLPEAWLNDYAEASAAVAQEGVLAIAATVIAAPVVEEVVFRGLILSRLGRSMPGWVAVLLSALLFGVCHGQAVWMAYAFVLGVIFGFLSLRARSIWPSLAAHLTFNGIGQLMVELEPAISDPAWILLTLAIVGAVVCAAALAAAVLRARRHNG